MGVPGDLLLSLAAAIAVIAAPLEWALVVLLAVWLLVPANLSIPHAPHLLLVHRFVLYAFVFRLIFRRGPNEPVRDAYRPTAAHAGLAVLAIVAFLAGVGFAPQSNSLATDIHSWLALFDLLVLFVTVLAAVRTIGIRRASASVVVILALAVAIGLYERFFHHGWSNFFFEHLPASYQAPGAGPLQLRGGHVRSQAASQFALEFGWVVAMLTPLAVVTATRWATSGKKWARISLLLPPLAVLVTIFSGSRSAELGAVGGVLVLVLAAGLERKLAAWGVAAMGAGVITLVAHPSLITSPFSTGAASDPSSIRLDRLPYLFSFVVHRPFTGLGFGGLTAAFSGGGLDDAYALLYGTLGVIGVLAWLVFLVTTLTSSARSLRAPIGTEPRALGAACIVGIVAAVVACASYDLVDTGQSTWTIVILAALGTAAAERVRKRARIRRKWSLRVLVPVAGAGVGFAVMAAAPVTASETIMALPVAPWVATIEGPVYPYMATEEINTLCGALTNPDTIAPGTSVKCISQAQFGNYYAADTIVYVRGPTAGAVRREVVEAFTPIYHHMYLAGGPVGTIQTGRPAWATTAPLSGAAAGLTTMFLWPSKRRRYRRRAEAAVSSEHHAAPDGTDQPAASRQLEPAK